MRPYKRASATIFCDYIRARRRRIDIPNDHLIDLNATSIF